MICNMNLLLTINNNLCADIVRQLDIINKQAKIYITESIINKMKEVNK